MNEEAPIDRRTTLRVRTMDVRLGGRGRGARGAVAEAAAAIESDRAY